ncbi:MAG TPA: universal stress protein [Actinomycetota bacterium]|jgi:nucleotide-binding universal stress UspA family protein|nr:universal stress protein [Actinomycetota bacterium]
MTKILVGTDTSASADLAVDEAARLAGLNGAELLVLHVRPESSIRDAADPKKSADPSGYLACLQRRFPSITVRSWAEHGDPAERLVAVAEHERVETIVMGNRGTHGSWWRVRDSVPNIVLRHAPCSVMIVDTRAAQ